MNTLPLKQVMLVSVITMGCAATPEFKLEGQEAFDNTALSGNWVCVDEQIDSRNGTQVEMSVFWQESLSESGEYFAVGASEFQVNGKSQGTLHMVLDGLWIANEKEIMTRGTQARVIAEPGSSSALVAIANTSKTIEDLLKPGKEAYSVALDNLMQRTRIDKQEQSFSCMTWDAFQQDCEQEPTEACQVDLLDSEQIVAIRKRIFSDS